MKSYFDKSRADDAAYCAGFNAGWLSGAEWFKADWMWGFICGLILGAGGFVVLAKLLP